MSSDHESENAEGLEDEDDTLEAELKKIHELESLPLDEEIEQTSHVN